MFPLSVRYKSGVLLKLELLPGKFTEEIQVTKKAEQKPFLTPCLFTVTTKLNKKIEQLYI